MKKYDVYYSGGEKVTSIYATCISKACKAFMETLEKPSKYKLDSKTLGIINYNNNHTIMSDFVVMEA